MLKHRVVEHIRELQLQFKNLAPSQAAKRLVEWVAAQPAIDRCALIVSCEGTLSVEAIGVGDAAENPQNTFPALLSNLEFSSDPRVYSLPQALIQQAFTQGESFDESLRTKQIFPDVSLNLSNAHFLSADFASGVQSLSLQVIGEKSNPVAIFYCESSERLEVLQQAVQALDSFWLFSEFQLQQMVMQRQQTELVRRQAELELKLGQAETAHLESENYLNSILTHSPVLISIKDLDGRVMLASDSFKNIDGVDTAVFVGKTAFELYDTELARRLSMVDAKVMETLQVLERDGEVRHKDGSRHAYKVVKFPVYDLQGKLSGVGTVCTDATERKNAEDAIKEQQSRLNYMAFHDSLTALPNRALFYDRMNHGIARARRSGQHLAVLLLDLDRFTAINDRLGYDAGDLFLKALAKRLERNVREMDTVARLGGDKFVLLIEGVSADADIAVVADKVLENIAQPLTVMSEALTVTGTIGVSMFPRDGAETDSLLTHADIAMCKAKEMSRGSFQFYAAGMSAPQGNFLLLENDLRVAIEQNQLTLYFQPQFDLQTNSLVGMEVLVRWQHPVRGVISPEHFIPLAEETGLIVELGDWVLRAACKQQKIWLAAGKYCQRVSVNLSPRQFRGDSFVQRLAKILAETELPARYLELEITESSAMEHAAESINMMNELNAMGVSLAIDDFGTGYSSLAYLKSFPIQKLKIDRSFINDVVSDQYDAAIAKSIINLAHNMGLNVVAEGVEHRVQAEWLRDKGCDMVQGFYYSKPMSSEKISQHLVGGEFCSRVNVVPLSVPA